MNQMGVERSIGNVLMDVVEGVLELAIGGGG